MLTELRDYGIIAAQYRREDVILEMLTESAKRMKILRIEMGMTQAEFADKFHFGLRGLQAWEQGRTEPPSHVPYLVRRVMELESKVDSMTAKLNVRKDAESRLKERLRERTAVERELRQRIVELESRLDDAGSVSG